MATAAYQAEPAAAAAARRFVRETLRSWPLPGPDDRPDTVIDDAVLLTSELVTNAIVHAGTSVHVTCRLSAEAVEIVVLDGKPAKLIPDAPRPAGDPAECTSGRGLHLPAELASAWGVTYARAAKAVWFRIGLAALTAGAAGDPPGAATDLDYGPAGRAGLLATTAAPTEDVPAWARRNLGRLGYEELLSSTVEAARAAVAADVAYLLDAGEDGELRVRAIAGVEPAGPEPAGADPGGTEPAKPDPDPGGTEPVRLDPGAAPGGAVRALAGAAMSLVTVPLVVDGLVTGVLAVAAAEPDRFGEHDAARLQDLADWSAPPLEQARLGELEHGRRERADFLAAASEELSVSLDEARIAVAGASLAIGHLASWCAVLAGSEGGPLRVLHAAHGDAAAQPALEWLLKRVDPPAGPAPDRPFRSRAAGWRWQPEVPAGDRPPAAGSLSDGFRRHRDRPGPAGGPDPAAGMPSGGPDPAAGMPPGTAELAADPAWCFPLDAADTNLGLLVIGGAGGHWRPREARELAAGLARRIAVALDNAGRHVPRRVSAVGQPPPRQEAARQESARPESARQEPARPEPARPEPARPEPARPEPARRSPLARSPLARSPLARSPPARSPLARNRLATRPARAASRARRAQGRRQTAPREPVRQDSPRQDSPRREPVRQEAVGQPPAGR